MLKRSTKLCAVAAAAALVSTAFGSGVASAESRKVTYVPIAGTAYVLQPGDVDLGAAKNETVRFELALKVRNVAAEQALAYAVSDPKDRRYAQFLSPEQFRTLFAPSDAVASRIVDWLSGAGMKVLDNPANHLTITVQGKASAANKAFRTDLHNVQGADGYTAIEPLLALSAPSDVAGAIDGFIEGAAAPLRLATPAHRSDGAPRDERRHPNRTVRQGADRSTAVSSAPPDAAFLNARPCSKYWAEQTAANLPALPDDYATPVPYAPCGYVGSQLRGAYTSSGQLPRGVDGRGVTVAITDAYASPTIVADINTYAARNGDAPWAGRFRQIVPTSLRYGYDDAVNGDQCGEQGWYGEETLDVEAVHAMAPAANVLYVGASSCLDGDLLKALNKIVDGHRADIITNSWGGSNEIIDPVLLNVYNAVFVQAALEGIGVFYSSGDSGDEVDNNGSRSVDLPASDPWVTAVGGTSIGIGRQNNYLFETGWGTSKATLDAGAWSSTPPGVHVYGGGGGTSQLFGQPAYQRGVVPSSISNYLGTGTPGRAVPDIAAIGDPQTGFLVGQSQTFPDGSVRYSEYRIGGTSLSSPVMAGIEALADDAAGRAHGFANPAIYQLGSGAYRDVVDPAKTLSVIRVDYVNGVDDVDGLRTTLRTLNQTQSIATRPGYDDVTGVGSPNGAAYITGLGRRR